MTLSYTRCLLILVALTACCLAYIRFTMPANKSNRILSIDSRESVKQCPEGEEAYFRTYPDVAKNWTSTAYRHWKHHGKAEMRHYICMGHNSEDKAVSVRGKKKDSGFIVVAIFKNEAAIFAEWISHYLWQGASHFYLIDNCSTDDYLSTVSKEVLDRINITRDCDHKQVEAYNSLLPMLREKHPQDWALVVDFDEFMYAKPPETVASYLSTVSDRSIGQVSVGWMVFASSGYIRQPKSVRCSFVDRRNGPMGNGKCAVRVSSFRSIHVHGHALLPGFHKHREVNRLRLNHYRTQSEEFWRKIKMTRGDVANSYFDHRNWDYFKKSQLKAEFKDIELCSILGCCAS